MATRTPHTVANFTRDLLPTISRATAGQRILDDVKRIVASDRWNSFDRFHETTQTLVDAYTKAGAKAEVYEIPTGGPIGSGRWIIPKASDIRSATLDIIRPIRQRVLDYRKNPWHIIQWSAATPPLGLDCELVVIDDQKQLNKMRTGALNNKLVLSSLNVRGCLKTFADKGAVGVITDSPVSNLPDATAWTKFGWGSINNEYGALHLVGLVLSQNDGETLRAQIKQHGSLTVRVRVDMRNYVGTHDLVSGIVEGADDPQDEVWVLSHSAEPGAIDNASGVAVSLEIARALETLIKQGRIPRPKRTIRLLSGYECYSFFHYIENTRRLQTPLAGVCIDTLGARPDICAGQLSWRSTIPMSATFVDRLGASILRATLRRIKAGYKLVEGPFVSTSDTLLGDPQYGFPCPWITTHYRENGKVWHAYHSSADVPALLSPNGLKAGATGMAAYLYYLANMGTRDVLSLAGSETEYTRAQLARARSPQTAEYMRTQHSINLNQLQRWLWEGNRDEALEKLSTHQSRINETGPTSKTTRTSASARRVPYRTAPITPTLENTPPPIAAHIRNSGLAAWALFWANGERNLAEIADLLSVEHKKDISQAQVAEFFEAHAQLNYARLINPASRITKSRLIADLKNLGLKANMDVMVHSSLSAVGHVAGGPNTVIDAILSVIGKKATLVMPSFNHRGAHIFNPATTPTTNGAIPNAFWKRPNVVRSLHPTHALAAFGPKAKTLCENHLSSGVWTADSPLSRFIHDGGYILSLGVDHNSSTAYHAAEVSVPCGCIDPFGHTDRVLINGTVHNVPGLAFRDGRCPVDPRKLNRALQNQQSQGKVGNADSTLVKALDLWHARRRHLKNACPTCPIKPRYPKH